MFETNTGIKGKPAALIAFAKGNVTIKGLTVDCQIALNESVGVAGLIGIYNNVGNFSGKEGVESFELNIENGYIFGY